MNTRRCCFAFALVALLTATGACDSQREPQVPIAPSTGEYGYAARFPSEVGAARGALLAYENRARRDMAKFSNYPGELEDPDWARVQGVVERADQAGRSAAYVARVREVNVVTDFFEEEKEPINKKVGGAAQYAASRKGCKDTNAYGAATHALDKAVNRQLGERLRDHNEAHLYIEENEDALGKKNIDKLEVQADEISFTSYITHIAVVEIKIALQDYVAQADDVKATLDRRINESQSTLEDENASEADKKAAQGSLEAAQQARQNLDTEVKQVEHVLEGIDERISQLQKEYDEALKALNAAIEQEMEGAPEPSEEAPAAARLGFPPPARLAAPV